MCLCSNSEVHLKQTFKIDVFICKIRSILEVDFQNLCIYVQTQKYTGSRYSKLLYFFSNSEVYLKQTFNIDVFILNRLSKLTYLSWNSKVFLKQTFNFDVFILKLISILGMDFLIYVFMFKLRSILWGIIEV